MSSNLSGFVKRIRDIMWNDAGVRGCRIYDKMPEVSITNEADWEAMCSFHSQQAKKLLSVVQPFLV